MLPFKKILCPTDFSEPAFVALKRAEELARHFAAELIVAHVIPTLPGPHSFPDPQASLNFDVPLFQQELAIKAEQMLKDLVSHHKVETRNLVTTGEAAPEILRIAHAGARRPHRHCLPRADGLAAAGLWVRGRKSGAPGHLSGPDHHGATRSGAVSHQMPGCVSAGHGP